MKYPMDMGILLRSPSENTPLSPVVRIPTRESPPQHLPDLRFR